MKAGRGRGSGRRKSEMKIFKIRKFQIFFKVVLGMIGHVQSPQTLQNAPGTDLRSVLRRVDASSVLGGVGGSAARRGWEFGEPARKFSKL